MQILLTRNVLNYFGLTDSTGNIARMDLILQLLAGRLKAAYGGNLARHFREDFFLVNSKIRPFNADALVLKLALPFFTETEEFEVTRGPVCGWSDFNPCFTCHTGVLTGGDKTLLDTQLGTVTVLCPSDHQLYRVRYMAGFEEDENGVLDLPAEIVAELYPMIEAQWNTMCGEDDESCNTCGTDNPAVLLKVQANTMLFRFLPHAMSCIATREVSEENAEVMTDENTMPDTVVAPDNGTINDPDVDVGLPSDEEEEVA